jgi:hypothetical protein
MAFVMHHKLAIVIGLTYGSISLLIAAFIGAFIRVGLTGRQPKSIQSIDDARKQTDEASQSDVAPVGRSLESKP